MTSIVYISVHVLSGWLRFLLASLIMLPGTILCLIVGDTLIRMKRTQSANFSISLVSFSIFAGCSILSEIGGYLINLLNFSNANQVGIQMTIGVIFIDFGQAACIYMVYQIAKI